jgi:hypothetical protein
MRFPPDPGVFAIQQEPGHGEQLIDQCRRDCNPLPVSSYKADFQCLIMSCMLQSMIMCCFVTDCSVSRGRLTIFLGPGKRPQARRHRQKEGYK